MHIIFLIKNMIDTITHCNDRISYSNRMSDLIILLVHVTLLLLQCIVVCMNLLKTGCICHGW